MTAPEWLSLSLLRDRISNREGQLDRALRENEQLTRTVRAQRRVISQMADQVALLERSAGPRGPRGMARLKRTPLLRRAWRRVAGR